MPDLGSYEYLLKEYHQLVEIFGHKDTTFEQALIAYKSFMILSCRCQDPRTQSLIEGAQTHVEYRLPYIGLPTLFAMKKYEQN